MLYFIVFFISERLKRYPKYSAKIIELKEYILKCMYSIRSILRNKEHSNILKNMTGLTEYVIVKECTFPFGQIQRTKIKNNIKLN